MKFSCDRCGKRYATADTPVPGRVYKLKCRACGHVIVLKAPPAPADGAARPPPAPARAPRPSPTPTPTPTATAIPAQELEPAAQARGPEAAAPEPRPPEAPAPETSASPAAGAEAPPSPPPQPDAGYVDLFEEGSLGDGTGLPLSRAARAGPPPSGDAEGSGELTAPALEPRPATPAATPLPAPRVPDLPRPPPEPRGAPLKLIGAGVLVMLGIVAVTVWRSSGRTAPPARPPASAPAASPAPAPSTTPPAGTGPGAGAPAGAPDAVKEPQPAEPAPGRTDPAPSAPAPEASPPPRAAPPPAGATEPGAASGALTPERIQQAIAASRGRFDACLAEARPGRGVVLDGRTVNLRVAITPAGAATYPTFDDVTLCSTELGGCLKAAARQMAFPRFEGEPVRIEVPITLPRR